MKSDLSKYISTYRSELMGYSILWIMMLHFTFTQVKPLGFVAQYGFAGVEIFMMVSGFGLFFSLDKNASLKRFYKKRLLRIFPTYYLLGIFGSLLLFHDNLWQYLFRYSTIGFWTGGLYGDWFIPSIIALYLFAPLFKKMFDKHLFWLLGGICLLCLLSALWLVDKEQWLDRSHFFLLYRIPAFIFGMACAYWLKNGISDKYFFILLFCGIPVFALLFPHHHEVYNYKYLSLVFLLPLFTTCFLLVSKYFHWLNPLISQVGKASLEIYLIQGIFFSAIIQGILPIPAAWHDLLTFVLIIVCTLLGILAHWLVERSGINRLF